MRALYGLNGCVTAGVAWVALMGPACSGGNTSGDGFGGGDPDAMTAADARGTSDAASSSSGGGSGVNSGSRTRPGNARDGMAAGDVGNSSGSSSGSSNGGTTVGMDAGRGNDSAALGDSSVGTPPPGDGGIDSIRQACVDHVNMLRATLNLAPLKRATSSQEACSDTGAQKDGSTMMAHSSAGACPGFGAQCTCPSLPVGGFSKATLQSSLIQCLDQMWAEGPPPSGTTVAACINDRTGCFLQHGHYIIMSDGAGANKTVSCGFYMMSNGNYWGNQDYSAQ